MPFLKTHKLHGGLRDSTCFTQQHKCFALGVIAPQSPAEPPGGLRIACIPLQVILSLSSRPALLRFQNAGPDCFVLRVGAEIYQNRALAGVFMHWLLEYSATPSEM